MSKKGVNNDISVTKGLKYEYISGYVYGSLPKGFDLWCGGKEVIILAFWWRWGKYRPPKIILGTLTINKAEK